MGESGNTPQETRIVKAIERSRIAVCFVAMFLGHSDYFRTFAALTVFSLAGLTAVESLLFGDASARVKNWPVGTPYQAQSACNNAALALVTLALLAMPETERTDAALATTTACGLQQPHLVLARDSGADHDRGETCGDEDRRDDET